MHTFLERRFYLAMAVLTVIVVVIGFAPNFAKRILQPSHPAPAWLWVHTVAFWRWILLLLVQTGLIEARRISLHRTLGKTAAMSFLRMGVDFSLVDGHCR